ncbi:carbohydrate ABC transporter permease [Paenibacillus sp. GCM10027626]|uniref:carbohydrate ABC transporter permease n=1 Tax=Paenibacillus sp. GCM10027626 TaxID=3273411 RepID=UPI0036437A2C
MKRRESHYSGWFLLPAAMLFTLFFVLPNLAGLVMSFTDWSSYHPLQPLFNGLQNFIDLFQTSIFFTAVKNTILFMALTSVVKLVAGLLLAIVLNNQLRYKNIYRTIIFSPYVINPMVVAIVFSALYNPDYGPINIFLRSIGLGFLAQHWLTDLKFAMLSISAMDIWMGIGGVVVIFLAGLQAIPKDYVESAMIDGAGSVRRFLHITLPLMVYAIAICTILCVIGGAKVFAQVYGLTNGGPADATQVYGTFIFKFFSQGLFGFSAAAGLIFTIVISAVSFILLRFFRRLEADY